MRAMSCGPIALRRRASRASQDRSVAARLACSHDDSITHAAAEASLARTSHCAPITSGWDCAPIGPWVHTQAQRVRHSPPAPRLRHTAMAPGRSPFARSISMSHACLPGKAVLRSIASGTAYSARRRRVTLSAMIGSQCASPIQGASSGASSGPPIACHRMAPSSATLRCASWWIRSRGSGDASTRCKPFASRGSRPWSTPCPSERPRLSGAVGGGRAVQREFAPRPTMARTNASSAPPASWLRLLRALGPRIVSWRSSFRLDDDAVDHRIERSGHVPFSTLCRLSPLAVCSPDPSVARSLPRRPHPNRASFAPTAASAASSHVRKRAVLMRLRSHSPASTPASAGATAQSERLRKSAS